MIRTTTFHFGKGLIIISPEGTTGTYFMNFSSNQIPVFTGAFLYAKHYLSLEEVKKDIEIINEAFVKGKLKTRVNAMFINEKDVYILEKEERTMLKSVLENARKECEEEEEADVE